MTKKKEKGLKEMYLFSVLIYIRSWMAASCAADTQQNDLNLIKAQKNQHLHLQGHEWETSEPYVVSFGGVGWSGVLRQEDSYHNQTFNAWGNEIGGGWWNLIESEAWALVIQRTKFGLIHSQNSKLLFERLKLSSDFLSKNPDTWESQNDYLEAVKKLGSLKVINNFAERGVNHSVI